MWKKYSNITAIFLKPNYTSILQPSDMSFYATVKSRYRKFRREYLLEKDQFPSDHEIYLKIKDITLGLDPVYVSACWKMAGLAKMDNSEDESSQVKLFYFKNIQRQPL